SAMVKPDHHAKSWKVAGPRVEKYRVTSSAKDSSRLFALTGGATSSIKAYVNCFPFLAPLQIIPSYSACIMMQLNRRVSPGGIPFWLRILASLALVNCLFPCRVFSIIEFDCLSVSLSNP